MVLNYHTKIINREEREVEGSNFRGREEIADTDAVTLFATSFTFSLAFQIRIIRKTVIRCVFLLQVYIFFT